jgi:hypothetical protein
MGGACGTDRVSTQFCSENKRGNHFGDLGVDEKIILKRMFKEDEKGVD